MVGVQEYIRYYTDWRRFTAYKASNIMDLLQTGDSSPGSLLLLSLNTYCSSHGYLLHKVLEEQVFTLGHHPKIQV
jgi:hypothetical protein